MAMRINLRTILAYLDDALEPAQAKQVGERISESTQAQELIERIKQVTRKRRLTTPPETAKIDPNTIAEFLDGSLSPEQQAELEQICIASDVHLAEVAACHQILSNAKGDAGIVPPTAKQRMVRLLHDPSAAVRTSEPSVPTRGEDADEKVFNINALVKRGRRYKPYLLIGAGVLGGILLVVAVNQVLQIGGAPQPEPIAKGKQPEVPEKKPEDAPKKPVEVMEEKKEKPEPMPPIEKPPIEKPPEKVEPKRIVEPEPKKMEPTPPVVDVTFPPFEAASTIKRTLGAFVAPPAAQPTILLQSGDMKDEWNRIDLAKPEVSSGRTLVSLPGCRSVVNTPGGVRLTLWGNLTEVLPIGINESVVELHQHPVLDTDMTLKRGRILLTSLREDRPALARVRFANPTNPNAKEHMDIKLAQKGTEVLIDRFSRFSPNEKFYVDPKHANRIGPMADMGIFVLSGDVELKFGDVTFGMEAPPGRASLMWNSQAGLQTPTRLDAVPDFLSATPPLFKGLDAKARSEMQRARDDLSTSLSGKSIDVGLREARASNDPYIRQLAVRSFGAIDDVRNLLDSLEDKQPNVRGAAILTARHWIAAERDNDYVFFEVLKLKYTPTESEKVMDLLHDISDRQLMMPETYELLIDSLDNPRLIIRQLAQSHLYAIVAEGRGIAYAADADQESRRKAQAAWRQKIPPGQLPKQMK